MIATHTDQLRVDYNIERQSVIIFEQGILAFPESKENEKVFIYCKLPEFPCNTFILRFVPIMLTRQSHKHFKLCRRNFSAFDLPICHFFLQALNLPHYFIITHNLIICKMQEKRTQSIPERTQYVLKRIQ